MKLVFTLFSCLFLLIVNCSSPQLQADDLDSRGIWYGPDVESLHIFDQPLALGLVRFFQSEQANSVVDFGCGMGDYQRELLEQDIYVEAYDGNPDTPFLTEGRADVQDLSVPFDLGKRFDWVMSLEVGDNVPEEFERIFIENLIRHADKGIVLSWAIPGQEGYGHCNEQSNEYIKDIMTSYGWFNDERSENWLRAQADYPWFNNTIMVFRNLVDPHLMKKLHNQQ